MEIKGIKYIAPLFDASGYAQASRGYVLALHKLGVPITIDPISFESNAVELGEDGGILYELQDKKIDYNIVITHLTPEFWARYYEEDKFNIGYTVWETDKLHPDWPGWINKYDAVFTCSSWNKEVFKNSGVVKPTFSIPHGIDLGECEGVTPYKISGIKEGAFKFYSVFQFTERKHPAALIKSYWHAFQNNENVALILKTYRGNFSDTEKESVRNTIKRLKAVTPMDHYPPIYLVLNMLSREELLGLHKNGDCYISTDRGEGFGLGGLEAGAFAKPIIVTGIGGVLEYAKPDNSYLINYTLTPVSGMPWSPWYRGDQMWAEPDCAHAISLMREVYNNQSQAITKGNTLRKYIEDNLMWDKVGKKMIDAILSI